MCEQCCAKTYSFGEVIPGWSLVRATQDGHWMKTDDWGLVRMNDPDFIWSVVLVPDPHMEGEIGELFASMEDDERLNALMAADPTFKERASAFNGVCADFQDSLRDCECDPMTGWELVEACRAAGYDREKHGTCVEMWLADHIGRFLDGKDCDAVREENERDAREREDEYVRGLREQGLIE